MSANTIVRLLGTVLTILTCNYECRADEFQVTIERPFLWELRPDGDRSPPANPAYLLGTIHVPDDSVRTLHPIAQKAWDAADRAFFEIDFLSQSAVQNKAMSLPDGQKLEDLISPELLDQLDKRLRKISPAIRRETLPDFCVVVWPLLLANLEAQARKLNQLPMDMKLYVEARERGRIVGGLEAAGNQLDGLKKLPMEDQIVFLKRTLESMDADDRNGINRLELIMRQYATGDEQKFAKLIADDFRRINLPETLIEKIMQTLLVDRNRKMAEAIAEQMKTSPQATFFFAVGVGHLVGEQSVQHFLATQGIKSIRVPVPTSSE